MGLTGEGSRGDRRGPSPSTWSRVWITNWYGSEFTDLGTRRTIILNRASASSQNP